MSKDLSGQEKSHSPFHRDITRSNPNNTVNDSGWMFNTVEMALLSKGPPDICELMYREKDI